MALLAMAGSDGPVSIGFGRTHEFKTGGRLLVQANDLDLKDNSGVITVEIQGGKTNAEDAIVWQYGYGEIDEGARKVKSFFPLPYWPSSGRWAGGPAKDKPVDNLGWVSWTPSSGAGHPGPNHAHAAMRSWLVQRDGTVALNGALVHVGKEGDGVRAWLISSRLGLQGGPWIADKNKVDTAVARLEVKRGDIIDVVVDCRANDAGDSFEWSPRLAWTR